MSYAPTSSNQHLCMDPNCTSVSKDIHDAVDDDECIQEKIWRKKINSIMKRWKRENVVLRRGTNGIELFSQESDSFTVMACRAEVKSFFFSSGLGGKNKNIKIGFKVRFEQRINESDSVCCRRSDDAQTYLSKWYEFRTRDMFSMVRWVTMLDPTINTFGLRETLLDFQCTEACCDGSGTETWLCKWDEIHPSMFDVQSQYSKVVGDDKSSQKHKGRRSSRAYSRARAFSVNESGLGHKVLTSNSAVNIHDNFMRVPDSPEVQPPRYSDIIGRNSITTTISPEDLTQETFQEFSPRMKTLEGHTEDKDEWCRRDEDDTFLPPYGPSRMIPLNMGIGEEIGLPHNIQKMWDPEKKKVIYVDHIAKKISLQPPEDKTQKKPYNEHSTAFQSSKLLDRLCSFNPDSQRLSSRRLTSISTLATNSSGVDISPGDDRWLPCYLESQLSAPCGTEADNFDKKFDITCGILPQIQENTNNKDIRIKILRPTVTFDKKFSRSWLNVADTMDVITAEHIAQQAFSKPVAILIDSSGSNGQSGWNGESGVNGGNGSNGRNCIGEGNKGESGHSGIDGYKGQNGGAGEDAENGQDIEIWLSVEEQNGKIYMKISGAVDAIMDIEGDRILFVSCKGGQGGNGGCGGNGGHGGHGGDGGNGGQGLEGDGGAGGNGGNGGASGFGGNGGRAGNGGNGGIVTIHALDPRLFMLVECDVRGGTSGNPGMAGKPGIPGKGGKGGLGGKGAYFTSYRNRGAGLDPVNMTSMHQRNALIYNGGMASPGSGMFSGGYDYNDNRDHHLESGKSGMPMTVTYVGKDGPPGIHGKSGLEGESGCMGDEGCWGVPGCIRWIITNKSEEESSTPELNEVYFLKYNVEVQGFEVFSDNHDGIMEPNEAITISNVKIINTGQMTLPKGAILTFPSTRTMRSFPNQYVMLPEIPMKEIFEVAYIFKACIHDVTVPNAPGPFFSHVDVESRVTLLNREFLDAGHVQNFSVQYPITLSNVETPKQMGRGEEAVLKIELCNRSSIIYGTNQGAVINQETNVELKVRLDRRLFISGMSSPEPLYFKKPLPLSQMHIQPDRKNGVSLTVSEIPTKNEKLEICLTLVMENRAELFDNSLIQVELYLRNRLIEYEHRKVRVAPYYHALGEPGDALFITGPDTTRSSFLRWEFLLNSLGMMDIDFWDIERYKGLSFLQNSGSRHEVTWIDRYRGKMIIFPHYEPHQISGWDICCHFGLRLDDVVDQSAFPIQDCETSEDQIEKTESLDSSDQEIETVMNEHDSSIILISDSDDQEMDKAILMGCLALLRVENKNVKYGGYHLFNPAGACYKMEVADKKLNETMSKLRKIFSNQVCVAYNRTINYEMMSNLYWNYGEINMRRLGLDRHSMLTLFCTGPHRHLDIPCHPSVFDWIPIIGQWAQVYLVMLAALGTAQRSCLMRLNPDKPVFMLPWGETISIQKCAALSVQPYLQNELFPNMKNCWRFQYLCKDIETNPSNYQGEVPLLLFTLWRYTDKILSLCNSRSLYNKSRGFITSVQRVLRDYYGDRNIKIWNLEAHKLMKDGLKLKFSDLIDHKYSFHPSRQTTDSEFTDLSKFLTTNEYQLIESINSLSH